MMPAQAPRAPLALRLLAAFAAASASGCGHDMPMAPPPPGPSEAQACAGEGLAGGGAERSVSLGAREEDAFVAFADGQEIELVTGGQGGTMITPSVAVEALASDAERPCWKVDLDNDLSEGGEVEPGILGRFVFEKLGDRHVTTGALYDLLGFDPEPLRGKTLVVTVRVTGTDFSSSSSATLRLR